MARAQPRDNTRNGIDVGRLTQTVEAIKANHDLARFQFHAVTKWKDGAQSETRIHTIHEAGQEVSHRDDSFVLRGDEPDILLGTNTAPNAVETVLHALTSCLTVGIAYNAAARGINLEDLELRVDGDLDLCNFLGISSEERPGFEKIRVRYKVRTDAPQEQIDELCEYAQKTLPVMDIISNSVPIEVRRDT